MVNLSSKVALVTGASRGIGHALALGLAQAGAAVLVNHLHDAPAAAETLEQIRADGGKAIAFDADIGSVAACRAMVARCVEVFGRLDIACCHAGITSWGKFLDYSEEAFDAVVDTNLKGTYFTAQAAAREMVKQGAGGRIIVTSSVVGNQAVQYLSAYAMTKAGLQMLVRNLVLELSPYAITINALGVGPIVVERNLQDDPDYAEKWGRVVPLRRAGWPQDVVGPALFLASEEAAYMTGETLMVDGGWSCYSPTPGLEFVEREGRVGTG
ncbi:MAG: SDR family oxidoreductase [Chloroflexi bacterium]|nr:SDR family oxidoreductase [Chloroflexota bacterium]